MKFNDFALKLRREHNPTDFPLAKPLYAVVYHVLPCGAMYEVKVATIPLWTPEEELGACANIHVLDDMWFTDKREAMLYRMGRVYRGLGMKYFLKSGSVPEIPDMYLTPALPGFLTDWEVEQWHRDGGVPFIYKCQII